MSTYRKTLIVSIRTITPFLIVLFLTCSCNQRQITTTEINSYNVLDLKNLPPQPGEDTWRFIEDLKAPMWTQHPWGITHSGPQDADLSGGVTLKAGFSDPKKRLETAYDDLRHFLTAGDVSNDKGSYIIETALVSNINRETFRLEIGPKSCRILASDIEGIRHGIFNLEDEMLRQRGPFLDSGNYRTESLYKRACFTLFLWAYQKVPQNA